MKQREIDQVNAAYKVARYFGSGRGLKLDIRSFAAIQRESPAISVVGVD